MRGRRATAGRAIVRAPTSAGGRRRENAGRRATSAPAPDASRGGAGLSGPAAWTVLVDLGIVVLAAFVACAAFRRRSTAFEVVGIGFLGNVVGSLVRSATHAPAIPGFGAGNAMAWVFAGAVCVICAELAVRRVLRRGRASPGDAKSPSMEGRDPT